MTAEPNGRLERVPTGVLVAVVVALITAVLGGLAALGGATLPQRTGPPIGRVVVERTDFGPAAMTIRLRNTGPDPVTIGQVVVNDGFVDFAGDRGPIPRLQSTSLRIQFPWVEGQPYTIALLTSTGLVIEHQVVAAATPTADAALWGLMALLGLYVGVVPVLLGMLVLPVLRRVGARAVRAAMAVTVGLLLFLAADAALEAVDLAASAGGAFGGPLVVVLGAVLTYVVLAVVARVLGGRSGSEATGFRLSLLIAIGIGLHNLGEGLAIGSAYAVGELALGAALVVGFALHNTTEGLAVVAPLSRLRPTLLSLATLGLIAGVPAVAGAVIGVSVTSATVSALLFGVGVGAIVQVLVQIVPSLRVAGSRTMDPIALSGVGAGIAVMYLTGILVAV